MKRRASIVVALLSLSYLAFADVSSAHAQAGSAGGSIGNDNKSVSGDRPRVASHPKRSAAKPQETSSGHSCSAIVGTWSWYRGVTTMTFLKDGTLQSSIGTTSAWTCNSGQSARSSGGGGSKEQYVVSHDGKTMLVNSSWGGGIRFTATRLSGGTAQ
jgi:hypothetical protein